MTILYLRLPSRAAANTGDDRPTGLGDGFAADLANELGSAAAQGATASVPNGIAAMPCQFAQASVSGAIEQQGSALPGDLAALLARATRVVMLVAASDVTLLNVVVPPMSPARLRAALPNLLEDQLIGDVSDCVFVAGPSIGGRRTVAVVAQQWLGAWAELLRSLGARQLSAVPAQLCLPWAALPTGLSADTAAAGTGTGTSAVTATADVAAVTSAAIAAQPGGNELTLRVSLTDGLGLTIVAPAASEISPQVAMAGETLDALAALAPSGQIMVLVPQQDLALFEALARERVQAQHPADGGVSSGAIRTMSFIADSWTPWIAGATENRFELMSGLVQANAERLDWRPWRWPAVLALLVLLLNAAAINYEWWRLAREAATLRAAMTQIYRAAYPAETVIVDPVAQMAQKIALAKRGSGQAGPDDFTTLAAKFGEAWSGLAMEPAARAAIAAIDYRERALYVRFKAGASASSAQAGALRAALASRGLALTVAPGQTGATVWQIHLPGK